jgi:hypothetical protein
MTRALALHATRNVASKSDASGAFVPEAVRFAKLYASHREGFDNSLALPKRRAAVHAALGRYRDLELIAFFCHGLRRSLQTGHDVASVGELADAVADASGPRVVVVLYACSTAHALSVARGGFADALRDALTARGKSGHVDAHTSAGHTVSNPFVQRFDMGDPVSEIVGDWVVPPGPLWKTWRTRMQATDLRFRFPMMASEQVRAAMCEGAAG